MYIFKYDKSKSSVENGELLRKRISEYKQQTSSIGYRFLFSQDEQISYKKVSPRFTVGCSDMMMNSLKERRGVHLSIVDNEILIKLA